MSMHTGMGPVWRHMRTDRSVADQKLAGDTLRRVVGFARPHRKVIAVFVGLTVVDAAMVVVVPLLIKKIVDDGILRGDSGLVTLLALGIAGMAVVNAVLAVAQGFLSSRIGESLIFDLRTTVFAHVQRMSLAFFTRTQTGALVSRLNNDVIGAQRAFTSTLSSTVSNSISVVVVGIAMLALSWRVTLLCLMLFPILFLASRWVGNKLSGLTRDQMQGNADLGNNMTERFNVGGALLLKLFGRRDEEDAKFAEKAAVVRDLGVRIAFVTRVFGASLMLIPALATALVYGVGGQLAIDGTLTVGTLLALATLLLRLLGPLQGLSNVRVDVMTALVSFERVFEVLDLPSMIQERPDAVDLGGQRSAGPGGAHLPPDVDFGAPEEGVADRALRLFVRDARDVLGAENGEGHAEAHRLGRPGRGLQHQGGERREVALRAARSEHLGGDGPRRPSVRCLDPPAVGHDVHRRHRACGDLQPDAGAPHRHRLLLGAIRAAADGSHVSANPAQHHPAGFPQW